MDEWEGLRMRLPDSAEFKGLIRPHVPHGAQWHPGLHLMMFGGLCAAGERTKHVHNPDLSLWPEK